MNVLLCPLSDPGYLYPAIPVGTELERRGHRVTLLVRRSSAQVAAEARIPALVAEDYGGRRALNVNRWLIEGPGQYHTILRAARDARPDVLVTSILCHGALFAAETLDLPVVVLGLLAHLGRYRARAENEPIEPSVREWRSRELSRHYERSRERVGLPAHGRARDDPMLGTATLLRGDPVLEYPGAVLPANVHHVGPCAWEPAADPAEVAAVTDHLDRVGKPVVYVHLGRVFGAAPPWPRLNAAFTGGPFQAIVEMGRSKDPEPAPEADLLVVRKPWMRPLIDRAGLVLSSGTSAPVLGALLRGRPHGVTPAGSEQPVLSGACVRAGVAGYVPNDPGPDPSAVLRSLWRDADMAERARSLGRTLSNADGAGRAAGIIESVAEGHGREGVVAYRSTGA
jgi:UDP:flavonoid glycosyltransferase YjiC (YdhE family)